MIILEDSISISVVKLDFKNYKIKSAAYSSQGSHTDQLDFCNWLADGNTTG